MHKKSHTSKGKINKDKKIFLKQRLYGVEDSPYDARDYNIIRAQPELAISIPDEYEAPNTSILNQGRIGSCVAHSCATALMQGEEQIFHKHNDYSRGYIYGNRASLDYKGEGMYVRQALSQLRKCGDVLQDDFPYNDTYPTVSKLIKNNADELTPKAAQYKIINYYRCYTDEEIKQAILTCGGCIVTVNVYDSFARDLHKPGSNEQSKGGHAMIIVGWTKDNKWIVQNSWGKIWGYKGKLFMDNDYPIKETWGVTVSTTQPIHKSNIFIRIWNWIKRLFRKK